MSNFSFVCSFNVLLCSILQLKLFKETERLCIDAIPQQLTKQTVHSEPPNNSCMTLFSLRALESEFGETDKSFFFFTLHTSNFTYLTLFDLCYFFHNRKGCLQQCSPQSQYLHWDAGRNETT